MKSQVVLVLNTILAVLRNFLSPEVVAELKRAAAEAMTHGDWSHGAKTKFVIDAGRAVVAATPNPWDDILYEIAAAVYVKKYAHRLQEAAEAE